MRILIRTDGDQMIGAGHVMRMLALAEQARFEGDQVCFACVRLAPALAERLAQSRFEVWPRDVVPGSDDDASWVAHLAGELGCDHVLADGYHFDARFLELARAVHADTLLRGFDRALIRRELFPVRKQRRELRARADRILVTIGGADPVNATELVLHALMQLADEALLVRAIVGPANPHRARLQSLSRDRRLELCFSPERYAELLAWSELAIAAAGVTALELGFAGLPMLLVTTAANQVEQANALAGAGAAVALGWHHALKADVLAAECERLRGDVHARRGLSERARALIDGRGAERVLALLRGGV